MTEEYKHFRLEETGNILWIGELLLRWEAGGKKYVAIRDSNGFIYILEIIDKHLEYVNKTRKKYCLTVSEIPELAKKLYISEP